MIDVAIIGGGIAGLSAGQYAARASMSVCIFEELALGGQGLIIGELENYPGLEKPVQGFELIQRLETQAQNFGVEFSYKKVEGLRKADEGHFVLEFDGEEIEAKTVILATGAAHRTLGCKGEDTFSGRGVSYCATCDGPFFKGKKMFVIGGGDSACGEALYLTKLSDEIVLCHRRDRFRAQSSIVKRIMEHPSIEVRFNTELKEIKGEKGIEKVVVYNNETDTYTEEDAEAVFIFVGALPRTKVLDGFKDLAKDEAGYIKTNEEMMSSVPGLFAAGDVRNTPFRQLVTAASDGAIAAHFAAHYIDACDDNVYEGLKN